MAEGKARMDCAAESFESMLEVEEAEELFVSDFKSLT